jgi:hypothetical protein
LLSPILLDGAKLINEQMNWLPQQLNFNDLLKFDSLDNHKVKTSTPIYLRINID